VKKYGLRFDLKNLDVKGRTLKKLRVFFSVQNSTPNHTKPTTFVFAIAIIRCMNNEELQKYIADERARGVSYENIKNALLSKGWKEEDVNAALGTLASGTAPIEKKKTISVLEALLILVVFFAIILFTLGNDGPKRSKSRDAKRITDIGQIQLGLEIYFDKYEQYPTSLDPLITEAFLPKMPMDPVDGTPYVYAQLSGGNAYALGASLEEETSMVLSSDTDIADATFSTTDIVGCHGESGRHCYDVAVLPVAPPQTDQNVILTSATFTLSDLNNALFTITSLTKTNENGRADLPVINMVMKAENNGTVKYRGDFLHMFYVNESGQLRFAPHGVSSYGDILEPLSEKNISYSFHVSPGAKEFVLLYGYYSYGSGIEELSKTVDGFFVDFTSGTIKPLPPEMMAQVLK
jgi:uncharacterized protein Smg (DUF494 family)